VEASFVIDTAQHPLADGCPPDWASAWGQDEYGVWVEFTVQDVRQRMRWIAPGRFWMGSPESELGRWDDEGPQHEVILSEGYWLFDTPCTQALWEAVTGSNPSHFKGADRPVESVSWDDTQRFIQQINSRVTGLELVLPTEAQWEYGCRAGTETATYAGDLDTAEEKSSVLEPIAWYSQNSEGKTHPVGQKQANAWGLYDMLGNVREWCQDYWQEGYSSGLEIDPVGPEAGEGRVIRGGFWGILARNLRAASRDGVHPDYRFGLLGFRCARVQE
jgi:formylglycine-generating enzyme required for sulfatase activity